MSEPTGSQFWWTWAAEAATATGTIGAVIVALFGGWLRAHLAAPRLEIRLGQGGKNGVRVGVRQGPIDGKQIDTVGRWYRLCVENKRRWSPAKDVRMLLLNFEQPNAAGQYRTTWLGEVPLVWSNQQVIPLTPTIGPPHECDLCSVVKQPDGRHTLSLHPLIQPFNLPSSWQDEVRFVLTLQARGVDSDSDEFRVEVSWDGQWADDTIEMAQHLVVRLVTPRK
jgi:hypothetical protein